MEDNKNSVNAENLSANNSGLSPPEKEFTNTSGSSPPQDIVGADGGFPKKAVKRSKTKNKKRKNDKDFTPSDLARLQEKLDKQDSSFFSNLTAKRYTKRVTRGIIVERLISISLILIFLTIGVVYSVSYTYVYSGYGINVVADQRITKAVSLSDDESFENLSVGLKASAIVEMDNISYTWLPPDLDTRGGGSHNGENYIAYTFYVLNSGDEQLDYISNLRIKLTTLNVETAIRVMVYYNGTPTVYTHTYESQIDSLIENFGVAVEEFDSEHVIVNDTRALSMGAFDRYTVVVWLEGEDFDCTNDKFSSELQMSWDITVIEDV